MGTEYSKNGDKFVKSGTGTGNKFGKSGTGESGGDRDGTEKFKIGNRGEKLRDRDPGEPDSVDSPRDRQCGDRDPLSTSVLGNKLPMPQQHT